MPSVNVNDATYQALELAARMSNSTAGEVVARLVAQASMPSRIEPAAGQSVAGKTLPVYCQYAGHRTDGVYDLDTSRIDITSGALRGTSHKTPTAAARAVVAHHKPEVNPNRNGWIFWIIDDGSERQLQSARRGETKRGA